MRPKTRADYYAESLTGVACDGDSSDVIEAARVAFARAIAEERARCLEIVKRASDRVEDANDKIAQDPRFDGVMVSWEDKYYAMAATARALATEIEKQIRGQNG